MKKKVILFLFHLLILFVAFGQSTDWPKKLPSGLMKVDKLPLLIDQTEVTLSEWFAFIYWTKENGYEDEWRNYMIATYPEKYAEILSDFSKAIELEYPEEYFYSSNSQLPFPWVKTYTKTLSELLRYPAVGLSYDQVEEYLFWRTERVNEEKKLDKSGIQLEARLISPEEWVLLSSEAGPRTEENTSVNPDTVNAKGCYLMNIRYAEICESIEFFEKKWGQGVFPVSQFWPGIHGIYDWFGNVSEMTNVRGVAVGGSYVHWGSEGNTESQQTYSQPEIWLGFRCVYEKLE